MNIKRTTTTRISTQTLHGEEVCVVGFHGINSFNLGIGQYCIHELCDMDLEAISILLTTALNDYRAGK